MDIKTLFEGVYQIVSDVDSAKYMYGHGDTPVQMGGNSETMFTVGVEFNEEVPISVREELKSLCVGSDWVMDNPDNVFSGLNPGGEILFTKQVSPERGMVEYSREEDL